METKESDAEWSDTNETGKKDQPQADKGNAAADINATVIGASEAISAGIVSITSAHSTGLLFAQGVGNQQANFQIAMAKTAKSQADMLAKKAGRKGNRLELKNDLAAAIMRFNALGK